MQAAFDALDTSSRLALIDAALQLADGKITKEQFAAIVLLLLQQNHLRAAVIGRMHATGWRVIGDVAEWANNADKALRDEAVATQTPYLDKFTQDLEDGRYEAVGEDGTITLDASTVSRRAESYAVALRVTANKAWAANLPDDTLINWVLDINENHCTECPLWAANGPYTVATLPAYPGDGTSTCKIGCHCGLETVDGAQGLNAPVSDETTADDTDQIDTTPKTFTVGNGPIRAIFKDVDGLAALIDTWRTTRLPA